MSYLDTPVGKVFIGKNWKWNNIGGKPPAENPKINLPKNQESGFMKNDLSKKKALVYGYGIFDVFLAQTLAQDYGEVMLFVPWMGPWPTPDYQNIGKGIPGITRVESYEDAKAIVKENKGTFYFFDVGDADKQCELRQEGCSVFGAGGIKNSEGRYPAQDLEIDRSFFKDTLKEVGLPFAPYRIVHGIDELSVILRKENDLWVKMDVTIRGIKETFHHIDWKSSVNEIDELAHKLGFCRDVTEFMVETPVEKDGVEIGDDSMRLHGESFENSLYGIEDKGDGYSCKVVQSDKLPAPIQTINKAMLPIYQKHDICGAMSSEVRWGKEKKAYYIDACQRMGNPPAACISEIYKNFSQVVDGIARGEKVKPEFKAKYAAELSIEAQNADYESIPMDINEKDWHSIKIRRACKIGDQYYNIPFRDKVSTVVKVVGLGETLEEAQGNCMKAAEDFKCKGKTFNKNTFNELNEIIDRSVSLGIEKL